MCIYLNKEECLNKEFHMHLLIDTNIFIYRGDDRVVSQNVGALFGLLHEIAVDVLIHPASMGDIQKDTDERRRNVILSKESEFKMLLRDIHNRAIPRKRILPRQIYSTYKPVHLPSEKSGVT